MGSTCCPLKCSLKFYDVWGTEQTYNHMSAAGRGPSTRRSTGQAECLQLGGINQNMVVSWPARIKDKGGLREQFVHVIDVVPTILEAAGSVRLTSSMASSRSRSKVPASRTPSMRATPRRIAPQDPYFEMMGQWAIYNDGWMLSTKVNRAPWEAFGPANPDPLNNQVLELYDLSTDFSQTTDLAAKNPQKSKR